MLCIEPRPARFIGRLHAERRFRTAAWSGTAALAAAVILLAFSRRRNKLARNCRSARWKGRRCGSEVLLVDRLAESA